MKSYKILAILLLLSTYSFSIFSAPILILPIGISGSGKSRWMNMLEKGKYEVVSPDEIRKELTGDISDQTRNKEVFAKAEKRVLKWLKKDRPVIFDATNLNTKLRNDLIDRLRNEVGTLKIQYKIFEPNPDLSKSRIEADISSGKERAAVPTWVIDIQYGQFLLTLQDIAKDLAERKATLFYEAPK